MAPAPPIAHALRIVALAQSGVLPRAIAELVGAELGEVYRVLVDARSRGIEVPIATAADTTVEATANLPKPPATSPSSTVTFPRDVLEALEPHAVKRGLGVHALVRYLISTIVEDGMIDAVLDDAEDLSTAQERRRS